MGFLPLKIAVGFSVYWVAYARHTTIVSRPKRLIIQQGLKLLVLVTAFVSVIFLSSYLWAWHVVDVSLSSEGPKPRLIRSAFILEFYPFCQPSWEFIEVRTID